PLPLRGEGIGGGGSLIRDVARSAPRLKSSSRSRGVNPRDRVSGDAPLRAPNEEYRCLYRSGLRTPPPPTWGGGRGGGLDGRSWPDGGSGLPLPLRGEGIGVGGR